MGKLLKVIAVVWSVCKKFDLEELKDIWKEIQEAIEKIKEARDAEQGEKAEVYVEAGKELADIYEVIMDAMRD